VVPATPVFRLFRAAEAPAGECLQEDTSYCREITAILRELLHRVPGIRAAAPPDRLLSAFINGIKHLPCEFTS
jgi:cytochrome P450